MIRFEVQVLVGVGWFSVHGDMSTAVVIDVYTGVQEGEDPVAFWFGCENNVRVNTVDMSCELLSSSVLASDTLQRYCNVISENCNVFFNLK